VRLDLDIDLAQDRIDLDHALAGALADDLLARLALGRHGDKRVAKHAGGAGQPRAVGLAPAVAHKIVQLLGLRRR
jgi:hypothetical protein